ncbi:MAG: thiamine phosphate synthase [Nitrospiraceae bacterium]
MFHTPMSPVDFRLYLVTDRTQTVARDLVSLVAQAVAVGLPAIQVRERDLSASELLRLVHQLKQAAQPTTHILVNDRLDVAMAADLDGVHLRSDSLPIRQARNVIGAQRLLAVSTHSVDEVRRAEAEGADFALFGPIYDTPSKRAFGAPQGLRALEQAARAVTMPVFAIGGITAARVRDVRRAGAYGVAVIGALLSAPDIAQATRALLHELSQSA